MLQIGLRKVDPSCRLAEGQCTQVLEVGLIECVGEEGVDRMVLRELLLEDEHVVHIGEDSVEIGRE